MKHAFGLSLCAWVLGALFAALPAHADNIFHRPLNMKGTKIWDTAGPLQLGATCSSTHSNGAGTVIACGALELPAAYTFNLDGTVAGNPNLSGNPNFGGNPWFNGNPNFTGAPTFNGGLTNASGNVKDALLSHTAATNWNVTTKTTLFTCPAGKKCYVTSVLLKNASTTSSTASCGVGWDSGATNVVSAATHAITATTYMKLSPVTVPTFGNAADVLGIKCTAEGSALTVDVDVYGFVE